MGADAVWLGAAWGALFEGDLRVPLLCLAALGGGIFVFFSGFRTWRRMRLIQDTPTSAVRSMALGRAELHGRAAEKGELVAPFTGRPCVYYRYLVEEEVRSSRRRRRWRTLEKGSSEAWPFYLDDGTGRALVDPRGATLDLPRDYRAVDPPLTGPAGAFLEERGIRTRGFLGFRKRLRLTEWHIAPGEEIYVLGVARERDGIAHERRVRIAEKLAALKSDPDAMAHLDTDGDGRVSSEEWDVARRLAVNEVEIEGVEDRVVVTRDEHGRAPFYIADRDEKEILAKHRWLAAGGVFGGVLLAVLGLAGLLHRAGLLEIVGR